MHRLFLDHRSDISLEKLSCYFSVDRGNFLSPLPKLVRNDVPYVFIGVRVPSHEVETRDTP